MCHEFLLLTVRFLAEVKLSTPTARRKQRFDDGYHDNNAAAATWRHYGSTETPASSDRSAVGRREEGGLVSPLHVVVPAACACILLSLVVLGVLLVRYRRDRLAAGRNKSTDALLPSPSPSSAPRLPATAEFSRSHEPCICLHCSRPIFVPTSAVYSLVETRSQNQIDALTVLQA